MKASLPSKSVYVGPGGAGVAAFAAVRGMGEGLLQIRGGGSGGAYFIESSAGWYDDINYARLQITLPSLTTMHYHDRSCGKNQNCSTTEESNLTILRRKSNSLSRGGGGGGGRRREEGGGGIYEDDEEFIQNRTRARRDSSRDGTNMREESRLINLKRSVQLAVAWRRRRPTLWETGGGCY